MIKKVFTLFLCMLFSFSFVIAQTVQVNTYGISSRGVDKDSTDIFDLSYNGLKNVGTNTKIYLKGSSDTTLASPTWTLLSKPAGSAADFGVPFDMDSATQIDTLTPDLVGTYVVVFSSGANADTITINAGTYLGIENCSICHSGSVQPDKVTEWKGTKHSTMLQRGLDGILSSHYSAACIKCHTTGYDVNAANNGFDDRPFVFPDTLFPGMYDSMKTAFPDAMKLANIQCESCHGPGSQHMGNITDSKMVKTLDEKNCAWCHDEGTHHGFPDQWEHSGDDATEFDGRGFEGGHAKGAYISFGGRSGCSPCHSGAGYVEWIHEGRPVDANGLPAATTQLPAATNISCAVCHDPHDATNLHQLRALETQLGDGTLVTSDKYSTGTQCMDCHRSRRNAATYASDINNQSVYYGPHHGPQADMMLGKNAPDFGIEFPSSPHGVAQLNGVANSCNNCHMAGDLTDANGNISHVGGHSWNMNDAQGNDFVAACTPCHGDIGTSFTDKKYYVNGNADLDGDGVAQGLQLEVKGMLDTLAAYLPQKNGSVSITGDSTNLTPTIMKAGYVYFWVEQDRSFGIHNPAFTVAILKAAIEAVGGITSINYSDSGIPMEYKLSQNYPNPFNPTTVINFSLRKAGNVYLAVYDALGREVKTLVNERMGAGNYKADWNATNYSSGIYFYRLRSGDFIQIKKMLLLK